jgi:hypothetical protein
MQHALYTAWKNRELCIVTQHQKQSVIAPVLADALGIVSYVPQHADTDRFGTFSSERIRQHDALTTARKKGEWAKHEFQASLVLASEGSFGPDPVIPFMPANEEWLVFTDFEYGFECVVRSITHQTNFAAQVMHQPHELDEFCARVQFPSHAIILRPDINTYDDMIKGIHHQNELHEHADILFEKFGRLYAETDMRAMHNPTRMQHIKQLTHDLVKRLQHACTQCGYPGYGVTHTEKGLPCSICQMPSKYVKAHVYSCTNCAYTERVMYPNGKETIDPMYCMFCNP